MRFGARATLLSFSNRWIVMPAIEVKPDERPHRIDPSFAAAKVDEWVRDVMSWPDMLYFYEHVSGDRLRPPTTLDVEQRVKPVLREAFRRGLLVALRLPLSPGPKKKTEDGVHAVPDKTDQLIEAIPKKPPQIVKEKSFLDVQVVNKKGKPLAGRKFKLKLPDGRTETGKLGADARIRKDNIDPGTAALTLLADDGDVFDSADADTNKILTLRLLSVDDLPLPEVKFTITFEDGTSSKGRLDAEGEAIIQAPPTGLFTVEYEDQDDIRAKALAARMHKALSGKELDLALGVLCQPSKDLQRVVKEYKRHYDDISGQGLVQDVKQAFAGTDQEPIADHLLAQANLSTDSGAVVVAFEEPDFSSDGQPFEGKVLV